MIVKQKFIRKHIADLVERDITGYFGTLVDEGAFDEVLNSHTAYAAVDVDTGKAVAIAGLNRHWDKRYEAWAIVSTCTVNEFRRVHRLVSEFLDTVDGRVECVVDADFKEGHRWARLLKFNCEVIRMEKYFKNGKAASLYSRIR